MSIAKREGNIKAGSRRLLWPRLDLMVDELISRQAVGFAWLKGLQTHSP